VTLVKLQIHKEGIKECVEDGPAITKLKMGAKGISEIANTGRQEYQGINQHHGVIICLRLLYSNWNHGWI